MPKLFNNIANLKFEELSDGRFSNLSTAMVSAEEESVPFSTPCLCAGPVEDWLNRLVETMRTTLRASIGDAVTCYEEKPRHIWLFDFCAQVSIPKFLPIVPNIK